MEETAKLTDAIAVAGVTDPQPDAEKRRAGRDAFLVGVGWLGTGLALSVGDLPFKFLLKEGMGFNAETLAAFMVISHIPIYVKPFAGILTDAVPLFGTRRRHYLTLSLLVTGLLWLLLAFVPRTFHTMLWTYFTLQIGLTMISTVLGGLMVEVGKRENTTGKLSAQRLGITRIVGLVSGPLAGYLATKAFVLTAGICAFLEWLLVPIFWFWLKEPPTARTNAAALVEVKRQAVTLFQSRILWSAAGLVILVIAAPGFGTPLLYYQTDTLKFSKQFVGSLEVIKAVCGMLGAFIYGAVCRRMNLRRVLALSIVLHAVLTLLYLLYRDPGSALVITGIEATTMSLALLPLYDLAARATPKGSEALGYSLMMSVWNFTNAMSDYVGSWLYSHVGLTFNHLIWVNAFTTALVLFAVPLLPKALMDHRDGEPGAA